MPKALVCRIDVRSCLAFDGSLGIVSFAIERSVFSVIFTSVNALTLDRKDFSQSASDFLFDGSMSVSFAIDISLFSIIFMLKALTLGKNNLYQFVEDFAFDGSLGIVSFAIEISSFSNICTSSGLVLSTNVLTLDRNDFSQFVEDFAFGKLFEFAFSVTSFS